MLATVGFVAQQSFHVIGDADPFKAIDAVGYMANVQILGAVGLVELATWDKTFSSTNPGACMRACGSIILPVCLSVASLILSSRPPCRRLWL